MYKNVKMKTMKRKKKTHIDACLETEKQVSASNLPNNRVKSMAFYNHWRLWMTEWENTETEMEGEGGALKVVCTIHGKKQT